MAKVTNEAMEWIAEMERRDADFKSRVDEELAAMRLEQQLVRLREARGLSQVQLARILGVSQQAVAKIESGRATNLELKTLVKHVLALGGQLEIRIVKAKPGKTASLLAAMRDTVRSAMPAKPQRRGRKLAEAG